MANHVNPRVGFDPDPYIGEVCEDLNTPTTPSREAVTPLAPLPMTVINHRIWKELARKDRVREALFSPPQKGTWEDLQLRTDHKFPIPEKIVFPTRYDDVECANRTAISIEYDDGSSRPIHANGMSGNGPTDWKSLIASQYPYAHYWDAIYRQSMDVNNGTYLIVDLTRNGEGGDESEPLFYPNEWVSAKTDGLKIHLIAESGWVSTYKIEPQDPSKPMTIVRRLHFDAWPDKGAVSVDALRVVLAEIENLVPDRKNGTLWVHCHAGVGRTGTLLAALLIKEQVQNGTINLENLNERVIELILALRLQRNEMMVSNKGQFQLLLDFARSFFV